MKGKISAYLLFIFAGALFLFCLFRLVMPEDEGKNIEPVFADGIVLPQSDLAKPDSIVIEKEGKTLEVFPDDNLYGEIYTAIDGNWWKQELYGEFKSQSQKEGLPRVLSLCEQEWYDEFSVKIHFIYENSFEWYDVADGKKIFNLTEYCFLMPSDNDGCTNISGEFLISEDHTFIGKPNIYVYWYSSRIFEVIDQLSF